MPSKKKKYNARFPPARIKKIMQTDEDVGKVAAAVPVIISRALELFIESLILKANETTKSRNAKTLSTAHIKQTILAEKKFDFLKDLVANIPDVQPNEEEGEGPSTPSEAPQPKPRGRPRKRKADGGVEPKRRTKRKSQPEQAKTDDSETEDADTDTANEDEEDDDEEEDCDSNGGTDNSYQPEDLRTTNTVSATETTPGSSQASTHAQGTAYPYPPPPSHMAGHVPPIGLPHPMMVPHARPPNSSQVVAPLGHSSLLPDRMVSPQGANNFPPSTMPGYGAGLPMPPGIYGQSYPPRMFMHSASDAQPSTSSVVDWGKATNNEADDDDYDS